MMLGYSGSWPAQQFGGQGYMGNPMQMGYPQGYGMYPGMGGMM